MKAGRNAAGSKKVSTQKDMSTRFDKLLVEDLIDVPDDFYEDEILYDNPEQLLARFEYLEDANLKNVLKTQDIEESLEKNHQDEEAMKKLIGGEIKE